MLTRMVLYLVLINYVIGHVEYHSCDFIGITTININEQMRLCDNECIDKNKDFGSFINFYWNCFDECRNKYDLNSISEYVKQKKLCLDIDKLHGVYEISNKVIECFNDFKETINSSPTDEIPIEKDIINEQMKLCDKKCIDKSGKEHNFIFDDMILYLECYDKCRIDHDPYDISDYNMQKFLCNRVYKSYEKISPFDKLVECFNNFKETIDPFFSEEIPIERDNEYTNGILIGLKNKKYTNEYFDLWVYSLYPMELFSLIRFDPLNYIKRYGYVDDYSITSIKIYENGKLI